MPKIPLFLFFLLASCLTYFYTQRATLEANRIAPSGGHGSPASSDAEPARAADALLERATGLLESYHSIAADVSYQVNLLGKQLGGKGKYREERSGPVPKVRLELKMPLGDQMGAMVEVCDGRYLWTYRRLLRDEKVTQIDLQRVAKETTHPGEQSPFLSPTGTIGMGGLASLMKELRRHFRFEVLGQSRFLGEPTWQLRGRWLPDRLIAILPEQKHAILRGQKPDYSKLPSHLPSHVLLTLGRDNLLPYRVEFRRVDRQDQQDPKESPAAGKSAVTLEWFNISVNGPMNPSDFEYRPGDIDVSNKTESFIERLRARAAQEDRTAPDTD